MKTLFIECNMGAAGDMIMSALLEICGDSDKFIRKINEIGLPKARVEKEKKEKCGITGTHIRVLIDGTEENEEIYEHHHEHHHCGNHSHSHTGMAEIERIIKELKVSDDVKRNALDIYRLIAEAESHVHGREIENIHFHEVGTIDAVCDIVGCCMLMEEIGAEKIIASPINVGKGEVKCAHGILSVPAPATAYILKGVPTYSNRVNGELCTPTGAAILKHFAAEFKDMPLMTSEKIGYGMGTRDFEASNCVRVFLGETGDICTDTVTELCCNIDDMTGEMIGYALKKITDAGALEVFTTSVGMKKNRPGIMISCICTEEKKDDVLKAIFKHTSTIGVRENICGRYILKREEREIETKYGMVKAKRSTGFGVTKTKAEYEELARIADENDISIMEI